MYMQIVSSVYHPERSPGVQGGQRVHRIATPGLRKRGSRRQTAPAARKQHLCNLINYSSRRNCLYLLFSLTFDIWGHFWPSCLFPSSAFLSNWTERCHVEGGGGFVFFLKQYFFFFFHLREFIQIPKRTLSKIIFSLFSLLSQRSVSPFSLIFYFILFFEEEANSVSNLEQDRAACFNTKGCNSPSVPFCFPASARRCLHQLLRSEWGERYEKWV